MHPFIVFALTFVFSLLPNRSGKLQSLQFESIIASRYICIDTVVAIVLDRQGCEGVCPYYSVRIANDGTGEVHFHGGLTHQDFDTIYHISPENAAALIHSARDPWFLALDSQYVNAIDTYTSSITLKFVHSEKTVTFDDYEHTDIQTKKLEILAARIDTIAMTRNLPY
ncbi:MAG: DUF6438 domain-containing protein [Ignavibacteriota bacterium]